MILLHIIFIILVVFNTTVYITGRKSKDRFILLSLTIITWMMYLSFIHTQIH